MTRRLQGRNIAPFLLVVLGVILLVVLGKHLFEAEPPLGELVPTAALPKLAQEAEPSQPAPPGAVPERTEAVPGLPVVEGATAAAEAPAGVGTVRGRVLFATGRAPAPDTVIRLTTERAALTTIEVNPFDGNSTRGQTPRQMANPAERKPPVAQVVSGADGSFTLER